MIVVRVCVYVCARVCMQSGNYVIVIPVIELLLHHTVYSTLLSRILGLEGEVGDPSDFKMCVTVFHYSYYFIKEGG